VCPRRQKGTWQKRRSECRGKKREKVTPRSWALLERSLGLWTLESFPTFYGTRRFNTEFIRALHLSLSWARRMQSTSPHPTSTSSILILSTHLCLGLPSGSFPLVFPLPTTTTTTTTRGEKIH
jgi:hypothetical protein